MERLARPDRVIQGTLGSAYAVEVCGIFRRHSTIRPTGVSLEAGGTSERPDV